MKKSALLFSAIALGLVFHEGQYFAFLIKYFVMAMLFFPCLSVTFPKDKTVYLYVMAIFAVMSVLAVICFRLLIHWDTRIAEAAFLVAFTPTAVAAPVVIALIGRNVDFVVSSVVITNGLVAFVLPFLLPIVAPDHQAASMQAVWMSTMAVFLIPLLLSQLVKRISMEIANKVASLTTLPFFIWLIVLYIATAKASSYLFKSPEPLSSVLTIGTISLCICLLNFSIGRYIGGQRFKREASQALGQKNTMFTTWLALEYFSPLVMTGPVFYLIFQNIYNSYLVGSQPKSDKGEACSKHNKTSARNM